MTFDWIIPGKLAACSMPGSWRSLDEDLRFLSEQGVDVLISLHDPPPDPAVVEAHGLRHEEMGFADMSAPGPELVDEFVRLVRQSLDEGRAVAVHCGAGLGRTGTMLACFLVHQGRSADAAIAEVRRLRPGSVETPEQEQAVRDYEMRLRG